MTIEKRDAGSLLTPTSALEPFDVPAGVDRRAFLMRSAVVGAAAVIAGCSSGQPTRASVQAPPAPPKATLGLSPDLDVVKKSQGPIMTTLDEFYKVGPGPSSSHTIGPMRITYDFYQRCTKLPADQLAKATGMKVHLFGSLSATGKGHGTERAALAGIVGKEPATVEPQFLDGLASNPDQSFPVKPGEKSLTVSLKDVIYDSPKGDFPHPNTMTCKLMGGEGVVYELEDYSVGGRFIEWQGYQPPKKGQPKYPMGAAFIAQAHDFGHQVVANAAESSLQHHLGLTCDPVAGFVQTPCIERCAFGAVKAWTGFMIASNEIPADRRVDFDTTVTAMALTAKDMNAKYKETSEGGLAVSLVLC